MKKVLLYLILSLILFPNCKNKEENLLLKQQKLLESQLFSKEGNIKALYLYNREKYQDLNQKYEILNISYQNIKNDFENNLYEIDNLISYYKKQGFTNLYVDFPSDIKQELKTEDKDLKTYILNNYLILMNNILDNEIKRNISKGYHFTNIKPFVKLEKKRYSVGEKVKAEIFIIATDTTQKPLFIVNNKTVLDSFDNEGNGVYSVYAEKRGSFKVKGVVLYPKSGSYTQIDSSRFEFDYIVK
jgi:hypothetical protein